MTLNDLMKSENNKVSCRDMSDSFVTSDIVRNTIPSMTTSGRTYSNYPIYLNDTNQKMDYNPYNKSDNINIDNKSYTI